MSNQITNSELLAELSTEQQQILSGGQPGGERDWPDGGWPGGGRDWPRRCPRYVRVPRCGRYYR